MKIAILSGKGGTGKTLLSVNLAALLQPSVYVDCDVEEPNGHLYFRPKQVKTKPVCVKIPALNPALCNGCRTCVDFCNFNALAYTAKSLLIFDDVCHSCGGCTLLCPQKALYETDKEIGTVQSGTADNVQLYSGMLHIGQATGIPIIEELLSAVAATDKPVIIDCPPGSACIVMESIKDADFCLLVTEPTLFGAHNLQMVHELVTLFNKPFGVIINKSVEGANPAETFCIENNLPVLGKIPYDSQLSTLHSNGDIAVHHSETYRALFSSLLRTITKEASDETTSHS